VPARSCGAEYAARSAPDGYTLFTTARHHHQSLLKQAAAYDPQKDFARTP